MRLKIAFLSSLALFLFISIYYTIHFMTGPSKDCFLTLGEGGSKKKYNCGDVVLTDDYTTYYLVKIQKAYFDKDMAMMDVIKTNKIFNRSRITVALGKKDTSRVAISENNNENLNFMNESRFMKVLTVDNSLIDFLNNNTDKFILMQIVDNDKIIQNNLGDIAPIKDSSTSFFSDYIKSCVSKFPIKTNFQTIADKCDYLLVGELKIFN